MRRPAVAVALAVGVLLAGPASAAADPVRTAPLPPPPDPAALAALPVAADPVPGLTPLGPCPAGVPPTGLDALTPPPPGAAALPGGGAGALVAVVDTGVAVHPRLAGRVADGGDLVAGRSGTDDCDGHGTVVAGVLAATPAAGDLVSGMVPAARVLAVRQSSAWFATPAGPGVGDVASLARAVRRAAAVPGVGVMTVALAACATPAQVDAPAAAPALGALRAAIRDAVDGPRGGVVVVAAAANTDAACPANAGGRIDSVPVPGWFDEALTVGAVRDGRPDPRSLTGPWVDLAAPGDVAVGLDARGPGLTTALTTPDRSPTPLTGTSIAVARVAAAAAALRVREPGLDARAVVERLERTADPVPGAPAEAVGAGVVDATAALTGPAPDAASPAPDTTAGPVGVLVAGGLALLVAGLVVGLAARRRRR